VDDNSEGLLSWFSLAGNLRKFLWPPKADGTSRRIFGVNLQSFSPAALHAQRVEGDAVDAEGVGPENVIRYDGRWNPSGRRQ